jgi:hypothetical protein
LFFQARCIHGRRWISFAGQGHVRLIHTAQGQARGVSVPKPIEKAQVQSRDDLGAFARQNRVRAAQGSAGINVDGVFRVEIGSIPPAERLDCGTEVPGTAQTSGVGDPPGVLRVESAQSGVEDSCSQNAAVPGERVNVTQERTSEPGSIIEI